MAAPPVSGEDGRIAAEGSQESAHRQERAWVRAAQAGSEEAMEHLFRSHWSSAYRAAWFVVHDAAAAEDIAQEAFLSAIRSLDRFDRRRPFTPWLHRIVVNRAIDWARSRALRREIDAGRELEAEGVSGEGFDAPLVGALSDEATDALASLPLEQRAVVVLRYLLDYTPGEISTMLDIPRGTVNSRLRRGLDSLEGRLERQES